uniref:Integrase catalytic domain-containing protein n=1 Tax=Pogona vitticeps TaxID=103695 RepID=A0ABM5G4M8_9SAUR
MPLTRSQMAEMGEVREPQVDQGSEDEFGSVQDDSTGEQNPELRKMLIAQQHELRIRQFELELQREKIALEKERMAFELRKLEMMNQNNNNNRDSEGGQLSKTDLKKFPVYHKGDCPEVFFSLVERAFVDFSVRETEKMTIMRSLISGSLAEVYAEMPEERLKDFAEFKKLVFARHGINAEQLRQRFRSLTKKPEQTFTQVGAQLVRLLEKWLSQEGTETFQQLKDLIALEQFYSVLHGELKFQVRERKPKSVAEAAEIADFISQIRKPLGEGKSISKPKETYSKYSQGPGRNQQVGGTHGEGKPSDMKQRPRILEGKPKPDEKDSKYSRKCYFCQGKGHLISECEKLKQLKGNVPHDLSGTKPKAVFCVQKEQSSLPLREPVAMATQSGTVTSADQAGENGPLVEVKRCLLVRTDSQLFETAGVDVGILDHQYRGLRDTCSQVTLCHPDIIPREYIIPNESMKVAGIEGQVISLPVAEVPVSFQGWRGVWRLAISSTLPAAVLVGNDLAEHVKRVLVITRSQANTGTVQGGIGEPETEAGGGSSEAVVETLTTDSKFGQEQKADATLQKCFEQVTDAQLTPETPVRFREKKGILYRETLRNISKGGDGIRSQLVVPEKYRPMILQTGHSDMFAAHLGVNKTQQRITQNFYWPEIGKQIKEFCKQCDVCQRQGNNRDRTKAKLCPLPVIDTPFKCIGVDIVGPLPKATKRGNRFILTIVDHATRYPEAIPLTNIETNTVADALVGYMSRMGFASEIITDLGASFTSKLMKRLWQICGIKHKETTAYHPEKFPFPRLLVDLNCFHACDISLCTSYQRFKREVWGLLLLIALYSSSSLEYRWKPSSLTYAIKKRHPETEGAMIYS